MLAGGVEMEKMMAMVVFEFCKSRLRPAEMPRQPLPHKPGEDGHEPKEHQQGIPAFGQEPGNKIHRLAKQTPRLITTQLKFHKMTKRQFPNEHSLDIVYNILSSKGLCKFNASVFLRKSTGEKCGVQYYPAQTMQFAAAQPAKAM